MNTDIDPADVIIRYGRICDRSAIIDIEALEAYSPMSRSHLNKTLSDPACHYIVAEHEREVIGYVVYSIDQGLIGILSLGVNGPYQREGVGRQLLDRVLEPMKVGGCDAAMTTVDERDLPSQVFLRGAGFVCEKVVVLDSQRSVYIFVKKLVVPESMRPENRIEGYFDIPLFRKPM